MAQKYPPQLDSHIRAFLVKHSSFYNQLSVENKKKFRARMALYMIAVEFMPQGWESIPEDIKGIIAANAAWLTFNKKTFYCQNMSE